MIWEIAAGILVACIPLGVIYIGLGVANESMRVGDEAAPGWIAALIGVLIGAAVIWYGFAHALG
jgi:hypothetical protein